MGKIYYFYALSCSEDPEHIRYVGVTQTSIKQRFSQHKHKAKSDSASLPVHKWMKSKYEKGLDIFIKLIDFCEEELWEEKEKYWISYYRKIFPDLLNLQKGGSGVVTAEMRNIDGQIRSNESHKKAIIAYKDNEILKFSSVIEATKHFNLKSKSSISNCLHGRSDTCCGYHWKFSDEPVEHISIKNVKNSDYNKRIIVYQFDLNYNLINTFQSIRQVMRYIYGEDSTASGDKFRKNILDKPKIYKDSLWSTSNIYLFSDKDIYQFHIDNNKFITKVSLANYLNISVDKLNTILKKDELMKKHNILRYSQSFIEK